MSHCIDTVAKALASPRSRRGLGALVAALAGAGAAARPARAAKCKRNSQCGECQRCKKGKCRKRANGTWCSSGTCQYGSCVSRPSPQPPTCIGSTESLAGFRKCWQGNDCCSGICRCGGLDGPCPGYCHRSSTGQYCHVNSDCYSNSCVSYRCQ
jgi:hypothetical protein